MSNSYSVSLQVWHPDANPESIKAGIGLPASRSWEAGDQRTTPKGTVLNGTYRESYCLFDLGNGGGEGLGKFLADVLIKLENNAPFIWQLRQTGGRVAFLFFGSQVIIAGNLLRSRFSQASPASASILVSSPFSEW